jgi:predicted nucleotidyltransferase
MNVNPEANLLLKGVVGSTAFGLNNEHSDTDYQGIFAVPTRMLLELDKNYQDSYEFKSPDTKYHEVGKYVKLALGCNPTILDMLWLTDYTVKTSLGAKLISLKSNFLSAKYVRDAYLGYAQSQFGKLNKDPRPEKRAKNARHFLRLLNQGFDLYTTGTYSVKLKNPEEFISLGYKIGAEGDKDLAASILNRFEKWFDFTETVLPEKPNREPINEWLLGVRHELYQYGYQDSFKNLEQP